MDDLTGKVALVTGGSRGIGAAAAIALAKAGCDVAVNYRRRAEEAEAVCREIVRAGRRARAVCADVSGSSQVREMVAVVKRDLGVIGVLVNNAGIARVQKIEEITEGDWDEMVDVNLKSAFLVTQAVLADMRAERWGRVINVSSVAAQTGGVVGPHYAASKAGMLGLTRSLASLMVKEGITVNAIAPALIATEMVRSNPRANPEIIPVGHFGGVDDVSSVVVLLAQNGYMTGQTVNVNGGWYFS
ncbi:MAG TPA: SDR family NAD(P)-dependent oxidoreductase [Bryobacteraceae bacterium]|jgi:3-oxoacyl-[acyl-carrier protein] reductase|nr:SDR family NAD(P)-dependent oxidoreductase [Bryobacteraceae bacterium]